MGQHGGAGGDRRDDERHLDAAQAGVAGPVGDAGLSSVQVALIVAAIAAGATVLSHVNDSGFWLVGKFLGLDVKTTLKTWTVIETTLGTTVFLLALGVWLVV